MKRTAAILLSVFLCFSGAGAAAENDPDPSASDETDELTEESGELSESEDQPAEQKDEQTAAEPAYSFEESAWMMEEAAASAAGDLQMDAEPEGILLQRRNAKRENVDLFRVYNPNTGEHFYTTDMKERYMLVKAGWKYEGIGFTVPAESSEPVYRLYNPNAGDHHYTKFSDERDALVKAGWKDEGIGWYSDDAKTVKMYRLYNPNATGPGSHHYTGNPDEQKNLVDHGWKNEGIGFYSLDNSSSAQVWELTEHPDDSGAQGMFYSLYNLKDGSLIIVDGGSEKNAARVRSVINRYGGTVDAWLLTHFHEDHIGAFNAIYENPGAIKIKDIYASSFDRDPERYLSLCKSWDTPETFRKFCRITSNALIHHPSRGDSITIDGLQFQFFNTYDIVMDQLAEGYDLPNNCCLTFRITGSEDTILFMGDITSAAVTDHMVDQFAENIKAEYVNACHHGNSPVPYSFYAYVDPAVIFLDGPEWLMTGDQFTAKDLIRWCEKNGIRHYDFRTGENVFAFR
ncbi:MAG: MBL fold metallo-hydrolase [Solobacterium sp.]|nr:MBL fold metallo-hydrolase [Solobacterium sp.]